MKARILVVEDDPVSRELIAALLSSKGHEVDVIDDGFGALRMAQEKTYDLVFVDYHLPEMDGYALARLMRSLGEKSNSTLKMIAITADRFGLAARRGVDSVFNLVLPKPIEPEALFAHLDECLDQGMPLDQLESFLAAPEPVEATPGAAPQAAAPQSAALALWRARGLQALPSAAVFPAPSPIERSSLEHCFRLVDEASADCLILLRPAGLAAIEALRTQGRAYLQPLFVLDAKLATIADVHFEVGDGESWTAAAATLSRFAARQEGLKADIAATLACEMRIAAYLLVADRSLEIDRDGSGKTVVAYTAGFPVARIIDAVKQLATRGLVSTKLDVSDKDGTRRLVVDLTAKGRSFLQPAAQPATGLGT